MAVKPTLYFIVYLSLQNLPTNTIQLRTEFIKFSQNKQVARSNRVLFKPQFHIKKPIKQATKIHWLSRVNLNSSNYAQLGHCACYKVSDR